ncbi:MAG: TonB-dependent receptor [Dysgonamonadaceae bacterium]|nr:TonB-dependent receptor [Dysgonamonadaceae bacterium]
MLLKIRTLFVLLILCCSTISAQNEADTLKTQELKLVEVRADRISTVRTSAPLQTLDAEMIARTGALQVSDAARMFAGVQVKDYGGVGGLKTVSLRSLGAAHTGIAVDGIPVSDYQSGQIDLGRFSLGNIGRITLNIGESDDIFQTARAQSLAGSLNIASRRFSTEEAGKSLLQASLLAGSFGLLQPSLTVGKAFSRDFSSSLSADYMQSKGDYPFIQTIGYDDSQTQERKRQNSAVKKLNLEGNASGRFHGGGTLDFKAGGLISDRQLPGPAIYYNDYSEARSKDRNFFAQTAYNQPIDNKTDFKANAKFDYVSSDYFNIRSYRFFQREWYGDAVFLRRFNRHFSASCANDLIFGNMNGNTLAVSPARTSFLSAFSAKYESGIAAVTAKLLYTYAGDEPLSTSFNKFSPYLGFWIKPLKTSNLRLRAFYKNTYRLPTLYDLYFSTVGKRNLKPENARQFNLGLTFSEQFGGLFLSLTADAYRNRVADKIIAWPTSDMNIWTMVNVGKTEITGLDMKAETRFHTGENLHWQALGTYTFQRVIDRTNPESASYGKQLPYTPVHAATVWLGLETRWFEVNYTLIYSGRRYSEASNRPQSRMKPFAEHGINVSRTFSLKDCKLAITAECVNFTDAQYEVVKSYPMQGRTFRGKIAVKF